MRKAKRVCLLICLLAMVMSCFNVAFADLGTSGPDGDMSIEEGAVPGIPLQDQLLNEQKLAQMNAANSARVSGSEYMVLAVPTSKQDNGHYCGPATVRQTLLYFKSQVSGYYNLFVPTQSTLAGETYLNTDLTESTDMTKIAPVLNSILGASHYSMVSIGTQDDWINKATYALYVKKPVILDIKAVAGSGWPYTTDGHFLNVSGYDRTSSTHRAQVTDPWEGKLGSHWYDTSLVYSVNNAHWRRSMIW